MGLGTWMDGSWLWMAGWEAFMVDGLRTFPAMEARLDFGLGVWLFFGGGVNGLIGSGRLSEEYGFIAWRLSIVVLSFYSAAVIGSLVLGTYDSK